MSSSPTLYLPSEEGLSHVKSSPPAAKFQRYFVAPVRIDWLAEVQLLLLTFSTGIQDAISFPGFHCFASKQTGNSVILAVGLAGMGGDLFNVPNIGTSLGLFIAGAIITGQKATSLGLRGGHGCFW
jgi:hypothetical protein